MFMWVLVVVATLVAILVAFVVFANRNTANLIEIGLLAADVFVKTGDESSRLACLCVYSMLVFRNREDYAFRVSILSVGAEADAYTRANRLAVDVAMQGGRSSDTAALKERLKSMESPWLWAINLSSLKRATHIYYQSISE